MRLPRAASGGIVGTDGTGEVEMDGVGVEIKEDCDGGRSADAGDGPDAAVVLADGTEESGKMLCRTWRSARGRI